MSEWPNPVTAPPTLGERLRRPGWLLLGALLVAGGVAAAPRLAQEWRERTAPAAVAGARPLIADSLARAPAGVRVRVQVLNATRTRGLARRVTRHLRDHGFDVVEIGTSGEQRATTLVLVRGGARAWADRVARAMGGAAVEARPDSSRYLDVTVLVGHDWRSPTQAFDP